MHSPFNRVQQNLFWPRFGYLEEYRHFPLVRLQSNHDIFMPRNWSSSVSVISSLPRLNSLGALHISVEASETSDIGKCCHSMVGIDSSASQILLEEALAVSSGDSLETLSSKEIKERQRREKIGLANKGRVPWNKGRKHSSGNWIQSGNLCSNFKIYCNCLSLDGNCLSLDVVFSISQRLVSESSEEQLKP